MATAVLRRDTSLTRGRVVRSASAVGVRIYVRTVNSKHRSLVLWFACIHQSVVVRTYYCCDTPIQLDFSGLPAVGFEAFGADKREAVS